MNNLKFRAWDKKDNAMYRVETINFIEKYVTYYFGTMDGFASVLGKPKISFDQVELMQSTGLFDKNGKEIFCGDIVRFDENGCCLRDYGKNNLLEKVSWGDDEFGWLPFTLVNNIGEREYESKNCEVIGTVYEHPHLLSK